MRNILAILFLLISFLGYSCQVKDKFEVKVGFIPFILFTSYIFLIAIAARLSLMLVTIIIANLIGLLLFVKFLYNNKEILVRLFPEYFLFFISIGILSFYLYDRKFLMYDDFSHWATISRLLLRKDAINTGLDTTISFKSYPQAMAYFIYGIGRFFQFDESILMIINSIFTLSGLFCFISLTKNKVINYILTVLVIIYGFYYNIRPYCLLVDTILSTTGFAIFSFVYYYDFRKENNYLKYFLMPMFVSLVYVKNSGLFLSIFILIYIIKKYMRKDYKIIIISLGSIFLSNLSWSNHIKNEFSYTGKHSMSISQYKSGIATNHDLINAFTREFLSRVFNDYLMWALISILIILLIYKKFDKLIISLLFSTICIYVIYQIGNYFMFISSMTPGELRRLACYDRYVRTIHMFLTLIVIYVLNFNYDDYLTKILSFLILIFSIFIMPKSEEIGFNNNEFRYQLEEEKNKNKISREKKILIKFKEKDFSRIYTRASMYVFESNEITDTFPGDEKQFNKNDYDYFIDLSK
ncbi:MAG: hypothetical protein E7E32_02315 [Anaerococcus hydrogenalis]|nr:hypothetical protein [Anaerococcus hydrogenalis]